MALIDLEIHNIRNISYAKLAPNPHFNLIVGANGSGKTSILESIYMLGMARSFRSAQLNPLIQYDQPSMTVFSRAQCNLLKDNEGLQDSFITAIGIERQRQASSCRIHINGQQPDNLTALVKQLPIQIIHADSFQLLTGSPQIRRKFLNWGVFHVEPCYAGLWQNYQRCLKQRNELLRQSTLDKGLITIWDAELCKYAEKIDYYRQIYLRHFLELSQQLLAETPELLTCIHIQYSRGWPENTDFSDVLTKRLSLDRQYGNTQYGPHRANIQFMLNEYHVEDVLSRGQQKLLMSLLYLCQGQLLTMLSQRECIYLIDDLSAELDPQFQDYFCNALTKLNSQVFITSIQEENLAQLFHQRNQHIHSFHVEHGQVTQRA